MYEKAKTIIDNLDLDGLSPIKQISLLENWITQNVQYDEEGKDKLVEVERKDLVASYIGQTAPKTAEVIAKAMGGGLFIDEAYTLAQGNKAENDYGAEAVATLTKAMEDHKDDLVVIFAGYKDEMKTFLDINPGISIDTGHPLTHFGFLHPKHLLASFKAPSSSYPKQTSSKFLALTLGSCSLTGVLFILSTTLFITYVLRIRNLLYDVCRLLLI